jgi:hypothetical protein
MPLAVEERLSLARVRLTGRVELALGFVFLVSAVFYVWTAGTTIPLSLHAGLSDRYNLLASAFLHFRLSVGPAPAAITHLSEPYNPHLYSPFVLGPTDATSVNDDVIYHGQLYFVWGAAPALLLLVPLHVLGLEPSASVTVAVYGVLGVGFVLAALRVVIGKLGEVPMWMCVLAGFAVSLTSAVPFLLRTPSVSQDAIAGGFCFTMAGVWLATSALAERGASVTRLALMSLCFGLAAGSRPALALAAIVLVPVYLSLRSSRRRRTLLVSLGLPIGVCFALLLAYNQARFHNPFELGSHYQLTGYDSRTAPIGRLSYVLPGTGYYALTPPRLAILFPFIHLSAPRAAAHPGLAEPEITGGLLPLAPIVIFMVALPWVWRRRPRLLGALAVGLLALAGAGIAIVLLSSYQFLASTERYEVDFAALLVLGGVAGWLALSSLASGYRRWLLRVGGGALAAWGCAAGVAISFSGYGTSYAAAYPATWRTLEDLGSPLSTAIATVIGHPVLAAQSAEHLMELSSGGVPNLATHHTEFSLGLDESATITVVSPGTRHVTLLAHVELLPGTRYAVHIGGSGNASNSSPLPVGGGRVEVPVRLDAGLNRLTFSPVAYSAANAPEAAQVMLVSGLTIAPSR